MVTGDLQHVSPAVCTVPPEHGLHPGPGPTAVARSQVCEHVSYFTFTKVRLSESFDDSSFCR